MQPVSRLALAMLAPLSLAGIAEASDRLPGPIGAVVTEVLDGDTLVVRARIWLDQDILVRVRLEGIDTPERNARCPQEKALAEQARDLTGVLTASGTVLLHDIRHDKYGGRVRARVLTAAGADLAEALIEAGLARGYSGDRRQPWC